MIFRIPQVTWLDNEDGPLENKHFDPDYEIDNHPQLEARHENTAPDRFLRRGPE